MPSSVMLIALRGRPLTVELRAVPDVLKPGSERQRVERVAAGQRQARDLRAGEVGRDRRRLRLDDQRAVADDGDASPRAAPT